MMPSILGWMFIRQPTRKGIGRIYERSWRGRTQAFSLCVLPMK
jgi:hypothetical protein